MRMLVVLLGSTPLLAAACNDGGGSCFAPGPVEVQANGIYGNSLDDRPPCYSQGTPVGYDQPIRAEISADGRLVFEDGSFVGITYPDECNFTVTENLSDLNLYGVPHTARISFASFERIDDTTWGGQGQIQAESAEGEGCSNRIQHVAMTLQTVP